MPAEASGGLRTIPPREIGGNLDIRQLVAGSACCCRCRPGRALSIGDLHFAQGDGEVCGTGIEVAGAVTIRVGLRPDRPASATGLRDAGAARAASFATTGIPIDTPMDLTWRRARRSSR